MGINKVQYGNTVLVDLTSDTVTADKLMQGYTAHDRSGALITGTATGGGGSVTQDQDGFIVLPPDGGGSPSVGGLEYETGTYTPSENTVQPYIYFTNTHSTSPFAVLIADMMPSTITSDSMCEWLLMSWYDCFNVSYPYSDTNNYYGAIRILYKTSTSASNGNSTISVTDNPYVTETYFSPYSLSANRYWRANRTYKWIAVWAPTT